MPYPSLSAVSGEDIRELIDSLEKQRKELQWLLSSLDNSNVKELNADVINAGTINGERIKIDNTVEFAGGYDPTVLRTEVNTQFAVMAGEIAMMVSQTEFDAMGRIVTQNTASINIQANQISQKVSYTDYTGNTIASLINQTATTVTILASKIQLIGYVTIGSLETPGAVVINEGNIYGSSFTVGRGTGSTLSMYSVQGSHRITSNDAAGFRIESNGTLSLQAGGGWTIYAKSKFWAEQSLQVTGNSQLQTVTATTISATQIILNGAGVVNVNSVQSMINSKANDIYDWVRLNFVAK